MDALVLLLVVAAWLALFALIAHGWIDALRKTLRDEAPPPFFGVLARRGIALKRVEDVAGIEALAGAVRRCVLCPGRPGCAAALSARSAPGDLRRALADCPNAALFERAAPVMARTQRAA